MEYKRYVPKIVLAHKVLLRGWPADMPIEKNIDNLSVQNLKGLLAKLRSKEIHWSDASEEELRHIKETTPIQQRAKRCDIGMKRGSRKPAQQPTPVSDDNNGNNEDDDDDDDDDDDANVNSNRPQKRKQHPANDGNDINNVNNGNVRSKKAHKRNKQHPVPVNNGDSDDDNRNNIESTAPVRQLRKGKGRSTGVQLPSACSSSMQSKSRPQAAESSGLVANTDLVCLTANAAACPAESGGLVANTDLVRLTVDAAASSSDPISHTLFNLAPSMQYGIGSLRNALDFPQVDFNTPTDDGFLRLPTPLPDQQRDFGNHYIFDSVSSLPDSSLMFPNFL